MKNNLLKYYIAAAYLCSTFVLFAQPGYGNGGTGNDSLEGADALDDASVERIAAPIDDYLWVLALIAIVFVFLKLRAIQNEKLQS